MKKIKLFCIPFAGGSATIYCKWKKYLDKNIELIPVELPGRGGMFDKGCIEDFNELLKYVYNEIYYEINNFDGDYCILGHSMGALITYELEQAIEKTNIKKPLELFISGRYTPDINKNKDLCLLEDKEFEKEILGMGATSEEVFNNKSLRDMFLPILRADFKVLHSYEYEEREKLNCNISILYGEEDKQISEDEILKWNRFTNCNCSFYRFKGGHFYINDDYIKIIEIINNKLT